MMRICFTALHLLYPDTHNPTHTHTLAHILSLGQHPGGQLSFWHCIHSLIFYLNKPSMDTLTNTLTNTHTLICVVSQGVSNGPAVSLTLKPAETGREESISTAFSDLFYPLLCMCVCLPAAAARLLSLSLFLSKVQHQKIKHQHSCAGCPRPALNPHHIQINHHTETSHSPTVDIVSDYCEMQSHTEAIFVCSPYSTFRKRLLLSFLFVRHFSNQLCSDNNAVKLINKRLSLCSPIFFKLAQRISQPVSTWAPWLHHE